MAFTADDAACILRVGTVFLPDSALKSVIVALKTAETYCTAQIVSLQSRIASINIARIPIDYEIAALRRAMDAMTSQFNVIGMALVSQCSALGTMNAGMADSLSSFTTAFNNATSKLNLKTSVAQQLNNQISDINVKVVYLGQVRRIFEQALSIRTNTRVATTLPPIKQISDQLGKLV